MGVLPVFMYHHVSPNPGDTVTVTPGSFELQMREISKGGYRTLTLDEVLGHIEGEKTAKGVCLTFDDGYLDFYLFAYPVLRSLGLKASVFLVSGWVDAASEDPLSGAGLKEYAKSPPTHNEAKRLAGEGRLNRVSVNREMVAEMQESGLVEFHSHTVTHRECDALAPGELAGELTGSRAAIERMTGRPCNHLCWPRGRYNEASVRAASKAGYRGVFTTAHGVVKPGDDPMRIRRVVVKEGPRWFRSRLRIYSSPLLSGLYLGIKKP